MSSAVEICNLALMQLGETRISSLDDNTEIATLCKTAYDTVADEVMMQGWACNTFRTSLAQLDETPSYEFSYVYQLPTDPKCLKVVSINEIKPGLYDFRIENGKLLIDLSTVKIKYFGRLTEPEQYDPTLKQAIIDRLISILAYTVTGDKQLAQEAFKRYLMSLNDNQSHNGQQGATDVLNSDSLVDVRA